MSSGSLRKPTFKQQAHGLIDQLPDDAGWRDLIYRAAVRQDVEEGLEDSEAGRVKAVEEVFEEFGLRDDDSLLDGQGPRTAARNRKIHRS